MLKKSKIVLVSAVMGGLLLAGAISAKAAVKASDEATTEIGAEYRGSSITLGLGDLDKFDVDNDDLIYDDSKELADQAKVTRKASLVVTKVDYSNSNQDMSYVYNGTVVVGMKNVGEGHLADLVKMTVSYLPDENAQKEVTSSRVGEGKVKVNTWADAAGTNLVTVTLEWNEANEDAIYAAAEANETLTLSMQFKQLEEAAPAASHLAGYKVVGDFQESEWTYASGLTGTQSEAPEGWDEQMTYKISITGENGASIKFTDGGESWIGNESLEGGSGEEGNIWLAKGDYTAYLKYKAGDQPVYSVYIAANTAPVVPQAHSATYYFGEGFTNVVGHLFAYYWDSADQTNHDVTEIFSTAQTVEFPAGYDMYILVRTEAESWDTIKWDGDDENVWGKTADLQIESGNFEINYGEGELLVVTPYTPE